MPHSHRKHHEGSPDTLCVGGSLILCEAQDLGETLLGLVTYHQNQVRPGMGTGA